MQQVTGNGWTKVMGLSEGPTNSDRITLDKLGWWAFNFSTGHRSAKVSLNGSPYVLNMHLLRRRASGSGRVFVDSDNPAGVPVGSYLTLEVRDRFRHPIDAKLVAYYDADGHAVVTASVEDPAT